MHPNVSYHRTSSDKELQQILELQRINLLSNVSETVKQKEGFVTINHTFEILKAMNNECAHTIAKHNDKVVGYALSMTKVFRERIDFLKPMFQQIDLVNDPSKSYIIMGQICVDKEYRGQGVFRGLYNHMKQEFQNQYDAIITLIDVTNERSIRAHKSVGFKLLKNYTQGDKSLDLVILEI